MSSRRFKTVSELQKQLKSDIMEAIENEVTELCMRVVRDNLLERVYWDYIPQGEYAYDRTYELLDSVTVGNFKIGTKYATFEIFMDTNKINDYITDDGHWNKHANIWGGDESDFIPLWIEEGTEGGLWDREGAHYMQQSHYQLFDRIHQVLANELRKKGWKVTSIS